MGAVGAKYRTTNQKEQQHQLFHLVVARVWSPLVFFAKGRLGATDRRRAGRL
jgi:hypothetical protein